MSNIIRFQDTATFEKKIIGTRKIENKSKHTETVEIDPIQLKQSLLQEINSLQAQREELVSALKAEEQSAREAIEAWRESEREEAKAEAQHIYKQASELGYSAGFDQGQKQAEEEFRQARVDMQRLIETAYEEKTKIIQDAEPFLLALSVRIAEKVLKKELKQHDDQLLNIVQRALKRVEEAEDVVMQVSLEDYPIILPFLDELKTYIRADSELKLVPVMNLAKGGCMIHTASGSYDVTVDSQLEEIKRQMLAHCEEKTIHEPSN